ncbi:MAG: hypothetical protein AB8B59_08520 [Maribacter sp.]
MKNKFKYPINYIAVCIAAISFLIGSILLLFFKITDDFMLAVIGYYYVILAAVFNGFIVFLLLINSMLHLKDFKEHLISIGLVLLNIPIANFYQEIAL